MRHDDVTDDDLAWWNERWAALPHEREIITPSVWATRKRYLPSSVTSMPGTYRFEVAPYLREIADCLSIDSPIREVALMKGAQVGATTGILENFIGYAIEHVKTAPMMLVTADAEMAKLRMESYITPMLQLSGLGHLIKSSDENNPRKTGKTDKKLEWTGGGWLVPLGAQNPNKFRSFSTRFVLRDETDGWPHLVGKDGDPMRLSASRAASYEHTRKIVDLSTPLIKGASNIETQFKRGDQRYYYVCCLKCGFPQVLRWRHTNHETGEVGGIVWDLDENGNLIAESVRYICQAPGCGHAHTNSDKVRLLSPSHGAEWRATATPVAPYIRSYHLSALYSPVGMQTWAACVQMWLEAWDVQRGAAKDVAKLQVFYNNVLGETFEVIGEKLRFEVVSAHRRADYMRGQIPNSFTKAYCGGPVAVLMCTVDVHTAEDKGLAVAVWGWCRDRRAVLVDYWTFAGDTTETDKEPWSRLRDVIEQLEYVADDGTRYRIHLTLIDSGHNTDTVYRFCAEYSAGVIPVKGRELAPKAAQHKEWSPFTTSMGTIAYGITVDLYKDRCANALRRQWDGIELQPPGHFNAPVDMDDASLKELTVETKRKRIVNGQAKIEWHRPSGASNELWDLFVYASAGLDMLAHDVCVKESGMDSVVWNVFFDACEQQRLFYVAA